MYVLGLMARIANLFGHGVYAADGSYDIFYVTMIKLPSIIADIGLGVSCLQACAQKTSL